MPANDSVHSQPGDDGTVDGTELLEILLASSDDGIAMAQISMPGLDGRPVQYLVVLDHGKPAEDLKADLVRREQMVRTPLRAPGSLH